ncbi:hypothetical protein GALL_305190 [mine drainage metagenome]|uniref:Uncharacterized protein n=1 Tax=mine drainage metagenome TaxID=410659 RepID=A0A1J5QVS8_9ZZZZ
MRTLQLLNRSTTPASGAMVARHTPLTRRCLRRLLQGLALAAWLLGPHAAATAGDHAAPPAAADHHAPPGTLAIHVPPAAATLVPPAAPLAPHHASSLPPPAATLAPGDASPVTRDGRAAGARR